MREAVRLPLLQSINHILLLWVLAAGVQTTLTIIGYSFRDEKSLDLTGTQNVRREG
jgi:hypothetical protein